ncbi:MAG TPA: ubiquinol-cytochrome c reductase iron-sulfur subunit [Candidatus Baltobacteraceae bacterium]|nr:ubiquinol-cytochrome c reductase iron-sulfur subunit [Candidatus Baltobacteraceae bacterium]
MAHAQAYQDPGTPEEQSRRQFLANATIAIGGVITLILAPPLLISLIPESLVKPDKAGGVWAPIPADEFKVLQNSTAPVKITFTFKYADAYIPPTDDTQFVWGVKLTPEQINTFKQKRPDLFDKPADEVAYPAVNMGFVIFSSVCPHLGCRYAWNGDAKRFICPCHGSQFSEVGAHLAGPAPRGLDPLPFREKDGQAQVTWIQYKSQEPDRVIVAYN